MQTCEIEEFASGLNGLIGVKIPPVGCLTATVAVSKPRDARDAILVNDVNPETHDA